MHGGMGGVKKLICITSGCMDFSTPAPTGKKVFQSEKFACSDTAARSMTGLALFNIP